MSIYWQLLVVCLLIVAAGAFVARQAWRTWHPPKGSCGGGCGCGRKSETPTEEPSVVIPVEQLTMRRGSS